MESQTTGITDSLGILRPSMPSNILSKHTRSIAMRSLTPLAAQGMRSQIPLTRDTRSPGMRNPHIRHLHMRRPMPVAINSINHRGRIRIQRHTVNSRRTSSRMV